MLKRAASETNGRREVSASSGAAAVRNFLGPLRSFISLDVVIIALLILGVALRFRAYLANRSLWRDESLLALNIIHRRSAELAQPLDYGQAAPLGFLLVERMAVDLVGASEYALRLFPLLCGVGSVFIFWMIARQLLSPLGVAVALAIFSVSDPLIYYSAEVKQYSSDVAIALLLWWGFAGIETRLEQKRWWTLGLTALLAIIAVWFSYPAAFVLGGVAMHWLWQAVRGHSRKDLLVCGLVTVAGVGSFIVAYLTVHVVNEHGMRVTWRHLAAPLVPRSSADVAWLKEVVWTLSGLPLGRAVAEIVTLTAILGSFVLGRQNRKWLLCFAGTLMLTWLASGLGKYPLAPRLWMFLSPIIILLVAAGTVEVWRRTREPLPILAPALMVLLLAYPIGSAGYRFVHPGEKEEIRPLLEHIRQHQRHGDVLYLHYSTTQAAQYYANLGLDFSGQVVLGVSGRGDWYAYEGDLEQLRGRARVWFLFSHVGPPNRLNDQSLILQRLDRLGRRLETQRRTGAAAYLYDLSATR